MGAQKIKAKKPHKKGLRIKHLRVRDRAPEILANIKRFKKGDTL